MPNRNTTLNFPTLLTAKTKTYAAAHDTTMTAIVREHLEAVTAGGLEPGNNPLQAYADGIITRDEAIRDVRVWDHAGLLVALGDAGLKPPWPAAYKIENEPAMFVRIRKAA